MPIRDRAAAVSDVGTSVAAAAGDRAPPPRTWPPLAHERAPLTLLDVVARVVENGFHFELAQCVDLCKDTRANKDLWARVIDLPCDTLRRSSRLVHWARVGDVARVREALDRGANPDARVPFGWAALHYASERNDVRVVTLLLDRGASVDLPSVAGRTALYVASDAGAVDVARELVARGANVNASVASIGVTALFAACERGHTAIAAELLRHGADVNACNGRHRYTPLMNTAQGHGHLDTMAVVLAAPGVDVNAVDWLGRTALDHARRVPGHGGIALLLAAGAR